MSTICHEPQALKQTYGYQCGACGALWDGHQVPCPAEIAMRNMQANRECFQCGSHKIFSVMPHRYEELKAEARVAQQSERGG